MTNLTANVAAGAASATAAPWIAPALTGLLQRDVATWPEQDLACIKLRTVRRVFRGALAGQPVYIKVFRADSIAQKARDSLRRGRGEREVTHLLRARALGLPAVEPLAYGFAVEAEQACSFVVTRSVDGPAFSFPADPTTARSVGALLRRVHELGLQPADLHAGNVLVESPQQVVLCDLSSLQHAGPPSLKKRAAALTFFCNPLDGGALDEQAGPVLRGYLDAGEALPDGFRVELERAAHRWRAAAVRAFGRRSMRSCRHTEANPRQRATARWFWHLDAQEPADPAATQATRTACRQFDGEGVPPRREGRRGKVWLTDTLAVKDRDAGKARRLWLAHYWLVFAGVVTPKPVALRLHAGRGQVFSRRVPNDDLHEELTTARPDAAVLARAASTLGTSTGRLHGHGLRNRDLKFENLVRDPATGEVAMVDLDGVRLHAADDTRGCGRDLGRLLASFRQAGCPGGPASLRRFLRGYLRARRQLLQQPPMRRILRRAEQRAGEWASAHA